VNFTLKKNADGTETLTYSSSITYSDEQHGIDVGKLAAHKLMRYVQDDCGALSLRDAIVRLLNASPPLPRNLWDDAGRVYTAMRDLDRPITVDIIVE
jgi:hypothetical protein